jgi:hypothetical protein
MSAETSKLDAIFRDGAIRGVIMKFASKMLAAAGLAAVMSCAGAAQAGALTNTTYAGQSGTVTQMPSALVDCVRASSTQMAYMDVSLHVDVTRLPPLGQFVSQQVQVRAWLMWWEGGRWVSSDHYLNSGIPSTGRVSAGSGSQLGTQINIGRVTVTSRYYEAIAFEVTWSGSPTSYNAHKYYLADANEYLVRDAGSISPQKTNTPYCYI